MSEDPPTTEVTDTEDALPIEADKAGLTEDKFKLISIMAKSGHTDSEICAKLSIRKPTLTEWLSRGVQDEQEGLETLHSQLLEAVRSPRVKLVERLEATLVGKALGEFDSKQITTDKDGNLVSTTIMKQPPNSKDLQYLLEALEPTKYGKASVNLTLNLETKVPVNKEISEDEWIKEHATIVPAEVVEEEK